VDWPNSVESAIVINKKILGSEKNLYTAPALDDTGVFLYFDTTPPPQPSRISPLVALASYDAKHNLSYGN
jgi:hypothetical protein